MGEREIRNAERKMASSGGSGSYKESRRQHQAKRKALRGGRAGSVKSMLEHVLG